MGILRVKSVLLGFCAVTALSLVAVKADPLPDNAKTLALLQHPDERTRIEHDPVIEAKPNADGNPALPAEPAVKTTLPESPDKPSEQSGKTVSVPETAPVSAETKAIDALPLPPPAEVVFTANDKLANALAQHVADHGSGKGLRLNPRLPKDVRQEIAAYYERSSFRPLWISSNGWTPAALSVREQLNRAIDDALDPADYPVPDLSGSNDPEAMAQAEISLSTAAILYARDARGARLNPARLSKNMTPDLELPNVADVLAALTGKDAGKVLEGYNPQHPGYLALKKKLAETRQAVPAHSMQEVPRGPVLKVGMRDERVPLIRVRLGLDPAAEDKDTYDAKIAAAVASFQKDSGLKASGDFNNQTIVALDRTIDNPRRTESDIIANMERWRWLPADMGERYIQVNVPEYELRIVSEGAVVRAARVIVGKSQTPTPVFSGAMNDVVVNPSWNIPPSILKNEVLPGLERDPDYAAKRGYLVSRSKNGNISVRQPPGERNALGRIKFLFPNRHAVYLHDTPNRNLFSTSKRAFSHGCVRVDQPFLFAEEVLGKQAWPSEKMRGLIGKGERTIKLTTPLPVHLTYFTLSVDEKGDLKRFDDIYGFNKQVRDALGLKG